MKSLARVIWPLLSELLLRALPTPQPKKFKPFKRPCLQCQKLHDHNNAYCSVRCCNAYRAKRKGKTP